jgi:hypothetical protein
MPKEIQQIQPVKDVSVESLNRLVEELNMRLFAISQMLNNLAIPQSGIDSGSALSDVISALTSAGIVEE